MELLVVLTGGTIDSDPDLYTGEGVFTSADSPALAYIEATYGAEGMVVANICQKDSKDINEADFADIIEAVSCYKGQYVVILVGTDAMEFHAKTLEKQLLEKPCNAQKIVRITGSMLPLLDKKSDASDNIDTALGSLQGAAPSVRVVMEGELFVPGAFYKDNVRKRFVSTYST